MTHQQIPWNEAGRYKNAALSCENQQDWNLTPYRKKKFAQSATSFDEHSNSIFL